MKRLPDKERLRALVVERLSEVAAQMAHHAETTRAGATHEEARPENDKDTRALEQTYLARGQAMRVEEVIEQAQVLRYLSLPAFQEGDAIAAGALIELESDDAARCVFLLPHGGGIEVELDGVTVRVVTPTSPLGKAILGRTVGDDITLRTRGVLREYVISRVV